LELGERWRPYRSLASWYLYRAVDLEKAARTKSKGK
jgi:methylated-DNA-[protein]-cysteine S-methyltransferase